MKKCCKKIDNKEECGLIVNRHVLSATDEILSILPFYNSIFSSQQTGTCTQNLRNTNRQKENRMV